VPYSAPSRHPTVFIQLFYAYIFFHRCCNYNFCCFCYCYIVVGWITLYFGYVNRFVFEPHAQRRHTVVSRSRCRDGFRFGSAAVAGCITAVVIASTFDRRRGRVIAVPLSAPPRSTLIAVPRTPLPFPPTGSTAATSLPPRSSST